MYLFIHTKEIREGNSQNKEIGCPLEEEAMRTGQKEGEIFF